MVEAPASHAGGRGIDTLRLHSFFPVISEIQPIKIFRSCRLLLTGERQICCLYKDWQIPILVSFRCENEM